MNAKDELLSMFHNKHNTHKNLVVESIKQSVPKKTMVELIMKNDALMEKILNGFNKDQLVDLVRRHSESNKIFINSITNNTTARNVIQKVKNEEESNRRIKEENNRRLQNARNGYDY